MAEVNNPYNLALLEQVSSFSSITNENGILTFRDIAHFHATLEELEYIDDEWIDEYEEIESDYIIPDEALEAFEESLGFVSLRKEIEQQEEAFLISQNDNWDENPDDYFIMDDFLRTVLNPYDEVRIGESIFKHLSSEVVLEVMDGSMSTITLIRNTIQSPDDLTQPLAAEFRQGNIRVHWGQYRWILGGGPSIEDCPPALPDNALRLMWIEENKSAGDLSVKLSDNVANLVPNSNVVASNYTLTVSSLNGSNSQVVHSGPGYMGNYTHLFTAQGAYKVCLEQTWTDVWGGNPCTLVDCDTVVTGSCCDPNAFHKSDTDTYANGERKIFSKVEVVNYVLAHKVKSRTKHYKKKNNGGWKQEKADYIAATIIGGTGGSVVYTKNSDGVCNVPHPYNNPPYSKEKNNKKRVLYINSPNVVGGRFYVHSESLASGHLAEDLNDDIVVFNTVTQDCN